MDQANACRHGIFALLLAAGAALLGASPAARADIYGFTDENGVKHFSNMPALDKRYKFIRREGGGPPPPLALAARAPSEADILKFSGIIDTASVSHGVDKSLVHAVIQAESGYNPAAVSRKGATGLMQLMPDTAKRYGVSNAFDPAENIHGGVKYLKDLLAMFNGNVQLALAGYNAGENAVIRAGNRIPPYPETVAYVPKVLDFQRRHAARRG
jgi:soluble lytic murein transglycosylase-like protein